MKSYQHVKEDREQLSPQLDVQSKLGLTSRLARKPAQVSTIPGKYTAAQHARDCLLPGQVQTPFRLTHFWDSRNSLHACGTVLGRSPFSSPLSVIGLRSLFVMNFLEKNMPRQKILFQILLQLEKLNCNFNRTTSYCYFNSRREESRIMGRGRGYRRRDPREEA